MICIIPSEMSDWASGLNVGCSVYLLLRSFALRCEHTFSLFMAIFLCNRLSLLEWGIVLFNISLFVLCECEICKVT